MNGEFTIEELVELRLDCFYAAQKLERLVMARLSAKHREKHAEYYSGAADKMLPALQGLAQEAVPA